MTSGPSMEERMREEFTRMRGEIPPKRVLPRSLVARARRGMAATIGGVVLATALVVGGSVAAWNAFGSSQPAVPAATGTATTPARPSVLPTVTGPAAAAELRSRPLALPTMAPAAACPTTPTLTFTPGPGTGFTGTTIAQRDGVVYLTFAGRHVPLRPVDRTVDGWYGIKDVWVIDSAYRGPFLIRGGRIDRPGPVRFRFTPETPQLRALLVDDIAPSSEDASTWRFSVPTGAYIRGPGCYAYQIDGTDFTSHIVFEATR